MKGETYRRKLQLIAGVTYTVSLPKKWIVKNSLTDKSEITIAEKGDGSLVISPQVQTASKIDNFNLDVDAYKEDLSQILFVLYYLGTQTITISSKKEINNELRSKIKNTTSYMAGTEIIYEDQNKIKITVLLDKAKVNVNQIYFRTALLIKSSIDSILGDFSPEEIHRNEEEIDRLYHLISKIILLAHTDADILVSSKIENTYFLTSYLLIAKKLENMSDRIFNLSEYLKNDQKKIKSIENILTQVKNHIDSSMSFFMNRDSKSFTKTNTEEIQKLNTEIEKLKDVTLTKQLGDLIRHATDVEEELTNISFYTKLIKQNIL